MTDVDGEKRGLESELDTTDEGQDSGSELEFSADRLVELTAQLFPGLGGVERSQRVWMLKSTLEWWKLARQIVKNSGRTDEEVSEHESHAKVMEAAIIGDAQMEAQEAVKKNPDETVLFSDEKLWDAIGESKSRTDTDSSVAKRIFQRCKSRAASDGIPFPFKQSTGGPFKTLVDLASGERKRGRKTKAGTSKTKPSKRKRISKKTSN